MPTIRSARGQIINFDLIQIKKQINKSGSPDVKVNRNTLGMRRRRRNQSDVDQIKTTGQSQVYKDTVHDARKTTTQAKPNPATLGEGIKRQSPKLPRKRK